MATAKNVNAYAGTYERRTASVIRGEISFYPDYSNKIKFSRIEAAKLNRIIREIVDWNEVLNLVKMKFSYWGASLWVPLYVGVPVSWATVQITTQ